MTPDQIEAHANRLLKAREFVAELRDLCIKHNMQLISEGERIDVYYGFKEGEKLWDMNRLFCYGEDTETCIETGDIVVGIDYRNPIHTPVDRFEINPKGNT